LVILKYIGMLVDLKKGGIECRTAAVVQAAVVCYCRKLFACELG
jgi:hypothetical protein